MFHDIQVREFVEEARALARRSSRGRSSRSGPVWLPCDRRSGSGITNFQRGVGELCTVILKIGYEVPPARRERHFRCVFADHVGIVGSAPDSYAARIVAG